ncbi:hypothetical protein K7472_01640 [Streptomyces sp. PTM05]|uniref:DNA primase n=1 Tax=Streptantibioticus parmotrematis TaxID=2873249 RepID=A0ABS7QLK1_9ACTN|nr:hypothetical protein [Streptantibioticus parmotrematis]MBY8883549.1 hypothetical protein [Streptantibioticus parmotrematis]
MVNNAKVGVALVGGYLLGRTKKARLAIGLGMFLAGRKISLDPQAIGKLVSESPLFEGLSAQARKQLVDATKSAATNALTNRVNLLADSLHERTLSLESGERPEAEADAEPEADEEPDRARDEDEEEGEEEEKGERRKARSGSSGARKTASKASSGTRKTASTSSRKASGTARKTASGKTASGATRKTGTTARKTASSARKATSRGGSRG